MFLWIGVAVAAEQFAPGGNFGQRPFALVVGFLSVCFLLYLLSLALVWKAPEHQATARRLWRAVLIFAVLLRLALWWSQPIQELDLYRYLWDGRVLTEESILIATRPHRWRRPRWRTRNARTRDARQRAAPLARSRKDFLAH